MTQDRTEGTEEMPRNGLRREDLLVELCASLVAGAVANINLMTDGEIKRLINYVVWRCSPDDRDTFAVAIGKLWKAINTVEVL